MTAELYDSWQVTTMTEIPSGHLNMLLQRKLYGIRASVAGKRGEKSSRRFDAATVLGIALVWALFKTGLRTEPIRRILNEITETRDEDAVEAAMSLRSSDTGYLVIIHELSGDDASTALDVFPLEQEISEVLGSNPTASVLLLPVRNIFARVEKLMDLF